MRVMSRAMCFVARQNTQVSHAPHVCSFCVLHSRLVVICSRRAATSADNLTMARSTFRDHRSPFLTNSPSPSPSPGSSSRCSRLYCASTTSSSLMGLIMRIGPSVPAAGCWNFREAARDDDAVTAGAAGTTESEVVLGMPTRLACGDESDPDGLLLLFLIWFHTNSSSETSSLASLRRLSAQTRKVHNQTWDWVYCLRGRRMPMHRVYQRLDIALLGLCPRYSVLCAPCIPLISLSL